MFGRDEGFDVLPRILTRWLIFPISNSCVELSRERMMLRYGSPMAVAAPVTTLVARRYSWSITDYRGLQNYGSGKSVERDEEEF